MLGVDLVEISKIKKLYSNHKNFLKDIFTDEEIKYCKDKANFLQHFAARYAAKEAFMKALGKGMMQVEWKQIETVPVLGKPILRVYGQLKKELGRKNIKDIHVSLSHTPNYAVACVYLVAN